MLGVVALVACGGGASDGARAPAVAVPETCATRLPPRAGSITREGPAPAPIVVPRSTIVVHAEIPLAGLRPQLEAKVPRRVVDERNQDIGVAGRLEVTVDRGPIGLRAEGDSLVVEVPLRGHAQACAKGSCYASCDPEARAVAKIPMRLGADYRLRTSDVHIDVTRGCQVRVLGGFVTVDVTPALRARLAQESKRVQASIDRELPDLSPQAARLWAELNKPRELPFGACIVLLPEEIVQGPAAPSTDTAKLRFGLLAKPEVRARCGDAPAARALPPLRDDPRLPPAADTHLAIVLAPDAAARAIAADGAALELGRARAKIQDAKGDPASGLVLDLAGEACGGAAVLASGASWSDPRGVHLAGVSVAAEDRAPFTAAGLDAAGLTRGVEAVSIPVPMAVDQLGALLPEVAKTLSDDRTAITATVDSAKAEAAGLRGADLLALVLLRASLTVRTK